MKKYKVSFLLVFLAYGAGTLLDNIFKPYIYKEVIDSITSAGNHDLIFAHITQLAIFYVGIVLFQNIGYRIGDYANAYFESKVMKELYDHTFDNLLKHSYSFFSNNFSGSIVAKSKRLVRSFETLQDILSYQVWFSIVNFVGIFVVLFIKRTAICKMAIRNA